MKGSHNSLTYAKPVSKWMNLFSFIWRNQKLSLEEQIKKGIKAFDIRLAKIDDKWIAAHGFANLNISPDEALKYINENCKGAYVRIVLEKIRHASDVLEFHDMCERFEFIYEDIVFYGGNYKLTWERLYNFYGLIQNEESIHAENTLFQYIGSMQSIWGKFWPWLWAKTHKTLPNDAKTSCLPIVFVDFIE